MATCKKLVKNIFPKIRVSRTLKYITLNIIDCNTFIVHLPVLSV